MLGDEPANILIHTHSKLQAPLALLTLFGPTRLKFEEMATNDRELEHNFTFNLLTPKKNSFLDDRTTLALLMKWYPEGSG